MKTAIQPIADAPEDTTIKVCKSCDAECQTDRKCVKCGGTICNSCHDSDSSDVCLPCQVSQMQKG